MMKVMDVTADAGAISFNPGVGPISFAQYTIKSDAPFPRMKINEGQTGTQITGQISMTNCVSTRVYTVVVFGKQG